MRGVRPAMHNLPGSSYLGHIDGLRAIALAGVLLFHFEVPFFRGGYAGVDIFLTLSGYLITRNILSEHAHNGTFSLSRFYSRRFFRLYPAATATVFAAVATAVPVFPPRLAAPAALSALAALGVSANGYFHAVSGYFDSSATVKPLLHMWSLSLEEQFYLLFAPLLAICFRVFSPAYLLNGVRITLVTLATASLLAAAYFSVYAPSFAFFHLPARMFQFLIGATLAVMQRERGEPSDPQAGSSEKGREGEALEPYFYSFVGLLSMIVLFASFVLLPESAPALMMLPVNLATAVLLALPDVPVSKFVLASTGPVVVGRLSYSAYLVHWPIYVYARFILLALVATKPHPIWMLVATFVAAVILKNTVEDPVRAGGFKRRVVFFIFLILTAALCFVPLRSREKASDQVLNQVSFDAQNFLINQTFTGNGLGNILEIEAPIIQKGRKILSRVVRTGDLNSSNTEPELTVFGNSFANHVIPALYLIGRRRKVWFRVYSTPSCAFVAPSQWSTIKPDYRECRQANEIMWEAIDQLAPNSSIVLSSLWGFDKVETIKKRLDPIDEYFTKRKLNALFLSEPPGLQSDFEAFFDCTDFLKKPLGEMLVSSSHKQSSGRGMCGIDLLGGAVPVDQRVRAEVAYKLAFPTFKSMRLANILDKMCSAVRNDTGTPTRDSCNLPVSSILKRFPNLADPGYKRDLVHYSILGSAAMSHVYEQLLFNNDPR